MLDARLQELRRTDITRWAIEWSRTVSERVFAFEVSHFNTDYFQKALLGIYPELRRLCWELRGTGWGDDFVFDPAVTLEPVPGTYQFHYGRHVNLVLVGGLPIGLFEYLEHLQRGMGCVWIIGWPNSKAFFLTRGSQPRLQVEEVISGERKSWNYNMSWDRLAEQVVLSYTQHDSRSPPVPGYRSSPRSSPRLPPNTPREFQVQLALREAGIRADRVALKVIHDASKFGGQDLVTSLYRITFTSAGVKQTISYHETHYNSPNSVGELQMFLQIAERALHLSGPA